MFVIVKNSKSLLNIKHASKKVTLAGFAIEVPIIEIKKFQFFLLSGKIKNIFRALLVSNLYKDLLLIEQIINVNLRKKTFVIVAYIKNHLSSTAKEGTILKELWKHKKSNIEHLWIFGCLAFAHVLKKLHMKFDAKSILDRFVGYDARHQANKVYLPNTREICISLMRMSFSMWIIFPIENILI